MGSRVPGRSLKTVAVVVALVGAAVGTAFTLGVVGAPSVAGVENRFGDVTESTTTIETDLTVRNPNPVGVNLGGVTVDYGVALHGVRLAEGTKEGVAVGRGNTTVSFATAMNNSRIPEWWVRHVRSGERSQLRVNASVHSALLNRSFAAPPVTREVETNVVGAFNSNETRPLNANREPVVSDPVLYVEETRGEWGTVDDRRTEVETAFVLRNPNSYPVTVTEVSYDVDMNDVDVGNGSTERSVVIPPGETRTVEATTVIDTQSLDDWWVTHLRRNQTTELRVGFALRLDLSAAGAGAVEVPFEDVTRTVETDIFGTKNDTAGGTPSGTPRGTPTASGETTAATTAADTGTPADGDPAAATSTSESSTAASPAAGSPTATAATSDGTATDVGTATDDGLLRVRAAD